MKASLGPSDAFWYIWHFNADVRPRLGAMVGRVYFANLLNRFHFAPPGAFLLIVAG